MIISLARIYRILQAQLRWPLSIFYQNKFIKWSNLEVQNVTVRAWLDHLNDGSEPRTYDNCMWRIYKVLQIKLIPRHSLKQGCPSWSAQRNTICYCLHESGQISFHNKSLLYWQNLNGLYLLYSTCIQTQLICYSSHWQVLVSTLVLSEDSSLLSTEPWREPVFML